MLLHEMIKGLKAGRSLRHDDAAREADVLRIEILHMLGLVNIQNLPDDIVEITWKTPQERNILSSILEYIDGIK